LATGGSRGLPDPSGLVEQDKAEPDQALSDTIPRRAGGARRCPWLHDGLPHTEAKCWTPPGEIKGPREQGQGIDEEQPYDALAYVAVGAAPDVYEGHQHDSA